MNLSLSKKRSVGGAPRRGQMPTKRTINLAQCGEKPMKPFVTLPIILVICLLAAAFSKFLVVDRLTELALAQREVSALQDQLNAGREALADFADLNELYAHYTYSGMTEEELTRSDRIEILALIRRVVLPRVELRELTLTGNELTLSLRGNALKDINAVVQTLENDELVSLCNVTSAVSSEEGTRLGEDGETPVVTARVIAYLNPKAQVKQG